MISREAIDTLVALAIVAALVGIGWVLRGWKEDAGRLAAEREQAKAYAARIERFDVQAQITLAELQDARAAIGNNRREIIREVTRYRDRPCLDDGAVRLLQQAAAGAGPDGAAGEVPGHPADAP